MIAVAPSDFPANKRVTTRRNFTKASLDEARTPPGVDRIYVHDTKAAGLSMLVTSNGAKSFYFRKCIGGRSERIRIGGFPEVTIEQARKAAARYAGVVVDGINPAEARRKLRGTSTLREAFDSFLDKHAKARKRTWAADEWQFKKYLDHWANRKLFDVKNADVRALHRKLGESSGPYTANRILALVRKLFNFAAEEGFDKPNPAIGITPFPEQERDRFLSAEELPRLFTALEEEPNELFRDFILVLLFTGARRGNVQAMAWADVDLGRGLWLVSAATSKNKAAMAIVLSPEAVAILVARKEQANGSRFVFPQSRYDRAHCRTEGTLEGAAPTAAAIEDLRMHDLRRTLGSWQAMTGASLPVIGKSLGHKNQATTAIYARLTMDPVRDSVGKATAMMLALGKPKQTKGRGRGKTKAK